jgi:hypothetical protein
MFVCPILKNEIDFANFLKNATFSTLLPYKSQIPKKSLVKNVTDQKNK